MNEILKKAIDTYGKDKQLDMVIEEMSELTKEICKHKRGRQNLENIAEEIADVEIMLQQLRLITGVQENSIQDYRVIKIKRLKNRLEEKA